MVFVSVYSQQVTGIDSISIMDEIIYLTSLGSTDIYPENRPTAFTNELPSPLVLDPNKNYEVGLLSMLCPEKFPVIVKGNSSYSIKVTVTSPQSKWHHYTYTPRRNIISHQMIDIVRSLNDDMMSWLKIYLSNYPFEQILVDGYIFHWDGCNITIKCHTPKTNNIDQKIIQNIATISISMQHSIAYILGFEHNKQYRIYEPNLEFTVPYPNPYPVQPTFGIEYVCVYTDIIQPASFGGKTVNILDCLDYRNIRKGRNIIYRTLNVHYIHSISIRLSDQLGNRIGYPNESSVTAILNIREKKTKIDP